MQNRQVIVSIPFDLAKDLWNLIHDAKHPHYENKVIEAVKIALGQAMQAALGQVAPAQAKDVDVPEAPPVEEPKEESQAEIVHDVA